MRFQTGPEYMYPVSVGIYDTSFTGFLAEFPLFLLFLDNAAFFNMSSLPNGTAKWSPETL